MIWFIEDHIPLGLIDETGMTGSVRLTVVISCSSLSAEKKVHLGLIQKGPEI